MIRILIADDHSVLREGLKQLLGLTANIVVTGEAENGEQVMELLRRASCDLILLDMAMPGLSGVNLITRIRAHDAKLPILVLSMHNEVQIFRSAFKAGASGYVTKDSEPETLLEAIGKVAAGGRFIDPALAGKMTADAYIPGTGRQHEQLSSREFDILLLFARGKSATEIAERLGISYKTVSTHKTRLMQKMNFRSNAEMFRYAILCGLVD